MSDPRPGISPGPRTPVFTVGVRTVSRAYAVLHQLHRHRFAGWSLLRWLFLTLALITGAGLLIRSPLVSAAAAALMVVVAVLFLWARRTHFVRFTPWSERPTPEHEFPPLRPGERLPLYVTGRLSVGERAQVVVHRDGYMEVFRSGEVALVAWVRPSRYLGVGALPRDAEGMWYAFLPGPADLDVQPGTLHVSGQRWPALRVRIPQEKRVETLFLAFASEAAWGRARDTLTRG